MKLSIQNKILFCFILIVLSSFFIFTIVINRDIKNHFAQYCKNEYCNMNPSNQENMFEVQGMPMNDNQNSFIDSVQSSLIWTSLWTILIAIFLSLALSNKITHPIREMILTTREIAKGNYQKKLSVNTNDEIGDLGKALNEMAEKLNIVEQLRNDLITNFSHEMVTPLTSINGYLEAIQDGIIKTEESKDQTYKILLEETKRLTDMIKDLRELSLIESGQFNIDLKKASVENIIQKAILALQLQLFEKNIKTSVKFPSNFPLILADEYRFQQIFLNLLTNAIRYTPKMGLIEIEGRIKSKKEIEISIQDSGTGIYKKDLPHVFERFYKADTSRSSKSSGSGIGLSIVQDLIKLHRGTISVESIVGKGTIFHILLPIP